MKINHSFQINSLLKTVAIIDHQKYQFLANGNV